SHTIGYLVLRTHKPWLPVPDPSQSLEAKARSYKIPALGDLFLMNNVHYMVWTVEQAAAAEKVAQRQLQQQQQQQQPSKSTGQEAEGIGESDGGRAKRRSGKRGTVKSGGTTSDVDGDNEPTMAAEASGGGVATGLGVLGIAWVERHKDIVEHYGAAYHEKTWRPLISALEAVLVTEEDVEPSEPGRFKAWVKSKFAKLNNQLDTILKQQAGASSCVLPTSHPLRPLSWCSLPGPFPMRSSRPRIFYPYMANFGTGTLQWTFRHTQRSTCGTLPSSSSSLLTTHCSRAAPQHRGVETVLSALAAAFRRHRSATYRPHAPRQSPVGVWHHRHRRLLAVAPMRRRSQRLWRPIRGRKVSPRSVGGDDEAMSGYVLPCHGLWAWPHTLHLTSAHPSVPGLLASPSL
ncbi:hypothetical protein Vretifemale_12980, partial [Volvox reticuliferus]